MVQVLSQMWQVSPGLYAIVCFGAIVAMELIVMLVGCEIADRKRARAWSIPCDDYVYTVNPTIDDHDTFPQIPEFSAPSTIKRKGLNNAKHCAKAKPAPECMEDQPCWDCRTMGNKICGPGHCTIIHWLL